MSASSIPPNSSAPHWTARHGKSIIFVILTLVAVGIYLALTIPVAVFPETDFPRIVVGVDNGVMPIDQMMVTITRPIEEELNSVQGLDQMWSVTSRGTAEIDLFFDWNVDMYRTLELVNAALSRARPSLPQTAKITANRLTFAAFPIMGYSITSDTVPQTALWEFANYEMKPRLNRQPGVSTVVVQGGQTPEYLVQPDPAKLLQTATTVPNILEAIARTNMIDSPGMIEAQHQLILSLVSGQTRTPAEIGDIVVKTTPSNTPVRIGDLASVTQSVMPVYTVVTANAKPAVLVSINRQPSGNTVMVADAVHKEIASIRKDLPKGVSLTTFHDESDLVSRSITSVRDAILVGLILASLIMALFLRDWGTSLVAGLVIPATIAITCIALKAIGQTFNLMTMGGLAAAVGLIIDDAIVVVENIVMHRDSGQSRGEAVRNAIREIRVPLIGSTLTPIVVFLPLISITGVNGVFFRALAVTVATALLTSLLLALTWTPTLSHYLLRRHSNGTPRAHASIGPKALNAYEKTLRLVLERRWALAALAVVLVAAGYVCYSETGSDLLPAMDEGWFVVDYIMPAGTSLAETSRVLTHIEQILRDTPEVEGTSRRTGLQLGLAQVTEPNTGDISVQLKPDRKRGSEEVIAEVRDKIKKAEPVIDVELLQMMQDEIGDLTGAPEPVVIKLFSQDPAILNQWAPIVGSAIEKIPGVVDVMNGIDNTVAGPARLFTVDPVAAAHAGFTPEEVELDTSAILQGEAAATPAVVNDRAYTIRVRFPHDGEQTLDSIRNTLLVSGTGKTATLGTLTNMVEIPGQNEIRRENSQRDVQVTARFEGMSLGTGMRKVQRTVQDLHLPSSIRVDYGGLFQEQQKSFKDFLFVLILAVVLVFIVLLFEFGNFAAPIAILCSALLSTCGVFLALMLTGMTFNLSSFMGLIMVIGIVAKNGILLLDADQRFRAEGVPSEQAMIQAGERRLRPIIMTALATVAGMLPLAFAIGAGSEMLQPLAIAVIGGILASMVLSLVVTPAVRYYIGGRARGV